MEYIENKNFNIDLKKDCGFEINKEDLITVLNHTNDMLRLLPSTVYLALDYKSVSSIVGAIYCKMCEENLDCIVNPIEKGHPDVLPKNAVNDIDNEKKLRNYGIGLEIKCTVGSVEKKHEKNLQRINKLNGLTWQAHHREVDRLLAIVWDFVPSENGNSIFPKITGLFYSSDLEEDDWGAISGTSGRNTKVCGMKKSGREKLGSNWICILNDERYEKKYKKIMYIK
ncbi:hypothetical protein [Staphylococcus haemolyticus]|uniref:hypothetical protein n=1 Tax=Staphylococcus haemolyticus TaxID=1283 RepID=UPI001F0A12CA|nr:hypothetical protein [Staphylococcus haemolyticus]MCH4336394.1 hypothetical protein [Staphylococcus haemolyticus]